jgi:hypothetical protein
MGKLGLIFGLILFGLQLNLFSQSEFRYADSSGNEFVIFEPQQLPRPICPKFLQKNLRAADFHASENPPKDPWTYEIMKIKRMEGRFCFDVRVMRSPQNITPLERAINYLGYSHYTMQLKRVNGSFRIFRFAYTYMEV